MRVLLSYSTMELRLIRWLLILGGVFNTVMGFVFFTDSFLQSFLELASRLEWQIFSNSLSIPFPADPYHRMLIHGFGAAAMILGVTLIYSAREPACYLVFILIDGLGRVLFGSLMITYVLEYSLMKVILVFALLELAFALSYLGISWRLKED